MPAERNGRIEVRLRPRGSRDELLGLRDKLLAVDSLDDTQLKRAFER